MFASAPPPLFVSSVHEGLITVWLADVRDAAYLAADYAAGALLSTLCMALSSGGQELAAVVMHVSDVDLIFSHLKARVSCIVAEARRTSGTMLVISAVAAFACALNNERQQSGEVACLMAQCRRSYRCVDMLLAAMHHRGLPGFPDWSVTMVATISSSVDTWPKDQLQLQPPPSDAHLFRVKDVRRMLQHSGPTVYHLLAQIAGFLTDELCADAEVLRLITDSVYRTLVHVIEQTPGTQQAAGAMYEAMCGLSMLDDMFSARPDMWRLAAGVLGNWVLDTADRVTRREVPHLRMGDEYYMLNFCAVALRLAIRCQWLLQGFSAYAEILQRALLTLMGITSTTHKLMLQMPTDAAVPALTASLLGTVTTALRAWMDDGWTMERDMHVITLCVLQLRPFMLQHQLGHWYPANLGSWDDSLMGWGKEFEWRGCCYEGCTRVAAHGEEKLSVCSGCMRARYCDQACQRAAYLAHKAACKRVREADQCVDAS